MALSKEFYDYLDKLEKGGGTGNLNPYPANSPEILRLQMLAEPERFAPKPEKPKRKPKPKPKPKPVRLSVELKMANIKARQEELGWSGFQVDRETNRYKGWYNRAMRRGTLRNGDAEALAHALGMKIEDVAEVDERWI